MNFLIRYLEPFVSSVCRAVNPELQNHTLDFRKLISTLTEGNRKFLDRQVWQRIISSILNNSQKIRMGTDKKAKNSTFLMYVILQSLSTLSKKNEMDSPRVVQIHFGLFMICNREQQIIEEMVQRKAALGVAGQYRTTNILETKMIENLQISTT